jgi:hypothetical protein
MMPEAPPLDRPTKRDLRVVAIAMIIRENTRFPSGTPRMSPEKAKEIAEFVYQYLVTQKVVTAC